MNLINKFFSLFTIPELPPIPKDEVYVITEQDKTFAMERVFALNELNQGLVDAHIRGLSIKECIEKYRSLPETFRVTDGFLNYGFEFSRYYPYNYKSAHLTSFRISSIILEIVPFIETHDNTQMRRK
jgi:hypothetical protein